LFAVPSLVLDFQRFTRQHCLQVFGADDA